MTGQSARVGPFLRKNCHGLNRMKAYFVSDEASALGGDELADGGSAMQNLGQFCIIGSFFAKKPASYSVDCADYRVAPPMNASPQRISFFKPRPENRCVYCNATSYGHPLTEIEANEEAVTRES